MSTPQGPNPPPGAADEPSDQPGWGRPPPGGWGQQPPSPPGQGYDPNPTRAWGQPDPPSWEPPPPRPPWGGQQPTQQQWAPHPGAPQPTQQWPGPPPEPSRNQQQWPDQGHPGMPEPAARRKSALPLIIIGIVVLGALAVLGLVTPAFLVTRVFDDASLRQGVRQVLTEDYGIAGVESVTCEEGVEVTEGASFECEAVVEGEAVSVPIEITSTDGDYEVGRPI